ncbi:hypothetical protein BDV12DRAFT_189598 [Aspergillus spectabilis]
MPYTARLETSLSSQHIEHSDPCTPPSLSSPIVADFAARHLKLPTSYCTASYVRRYRQSPSNSKSFVFTAPDKDWESTSSSDFSVSVGQSSLPVSEGPIPSGALFLSPESGQSSSHGGSANRSNDVLQLDELEAAVRLIEQRCSKSSDRHPSEDMSSTSRLRVATDVRELSRPSLTKDNRMDSRSRPFIEEALASSPEESDRDDEPQTHYPMVRKKSGELVRPALRRRPSSMPGTPTYSKAVHFDTQLEHIRHFMLLDKPQAVSTGSSPIEDLDTDGEYPFNGDSSKTPSFVWGVHISNYPHKPPSQPHQHVRLECLFLSSDKHALVGTVVVANLAFQKHVAARFTFDGWHSISEITAEYIHDVRWKQLQDGYDRFMFNIGLDEQLDLDKETMFVCIRYSVNGQEFWDNNEARDYRVNFTKILKPGLRNQAIPRLCTRANLPQSMSVTAYGSHAQSMPSSLKEISNMHRYISFCTPLNDQKAGYEDDDDVPHDFESSVHMRRDKQPHQVFSNSYDFELSLSAAMRTKSDRDRTLLTARAKSGTIVPQVETRSVLPSFLQPAQPSLEKPSSLVLGRPNCESSVYRELADRYSFYGSSNNSLNLNHPLEVNDSGSSHTASFPSPPSPPGEYSLKEGSAESSRSLPASPPTFSYNYFEPIQVSLFKKTQTPAMISG